MLVYGGYLLIYGGILLLFFPVFLTRKHVVQKHVSKHVLETKACFYLEATAKNRKEKREVLKLCEVAVFYRALFCSQFHQRFVDSMRASIAFEVCKCAQISTSG